MVKADIATREGREKLIAETIQYFGRIDVLINNTGISARKDFLKGTEDEFDAIVNTNVKVLFFSTSMR